MKKILSIILFLLMIGVSYADNDQLIGPTGGGTMTWPAAAGFAIYGGSNSWLTSIGMGTMANLGLCQYTNASGISCGIALATFEPALGNPGVNGYVLSSTTAGVRSWVANGTGGGANASGYYLVNQATNAPVNAINLGGGSTGLVFQTISGGVATMSTKVIGTDVEAHSATLDSIVANTWTGEPSITTIGTLSAGGVPYSLLTGVVPTWNQSTTGNSATATALASTPSLCSAGAAPQGVSTGGNALDCTAYQTPLIFSLPLLNTSGDISCNAATASLSGCTNLSTAQTPWVGNVNGGGYTLTGVSEIVTSIVPTGYNDLYIPELGYALNAGYGTSSTGATTQGPTAYFEKYAGNMTYTSGQWDTALKASYYGEGTQTQNATAIQGFYFGDNTAGGTGISGMGWSRTATSGNVWGGWLVAGILNTSNKTAQAIGLEIDVDNAAYDNGYIYLPSGSNGATVGLWINNSSAGTPVAPASMAIGIPSGATYKWYSGLNFMENAIHPDLTDPNNGTLFVGKEIMLQGSSSSSDYAGIRFRNYHSTGIDFEGTFTKASIGGSVGLDEPPISGMPLVIGSSTTLAAGQPSLMIQGQTNTERIYIQSSNAAGSVFAGMNASNGTNGGVQTAYPGNTCSGSTLAGSTLTSYMGGGNDGTSTTQNAGWYVNSAYMRFYPYNTWTAVGALQTYNVGNAGSGYHVGDIIAVTGGNNNAYLIVATVSGTTVATFYAVCYAGTMPGSGYSATTYNTTHVTGSGNDALTVVVSAVAATADRSSYIAFGDTPPGSTSMAERMRIFASGGVSINNTTDPGAGNLSVTGQPYFQQASPPTVSCNAGSPSAVTGTNSNGHFTVGTAAVNCTVTFVPAWPTAIYGCVVSANTSTALPYIDASTPPSTTAFKVDFVTTGTPVIYYHCAGD